MAKDFKINSNMDFNDRGVAKNSLEVNPGDFIKYALGFIDLCGASGDIEGVSRTLNTFASNNQTVAKDVVLYRKAKANDLYTAETNAGTMTQADVGSYFLLEDATQKVDYSSKSAVFGQLQLKEVLGAKLGVFSVVNIREDAIV